MTEQPGEADQRRLDIDWVKALAAALAAMSSAVLLSTLGAVGTIIGAAVGSLVATLGTTLYAQWLARSKQTVVKAQEIALGRIGVAQAEVRRAQRRGPASATGAAHLDHADEELAAAKEELADAGEPGPDDPAAPGWRERLTELPWKRIGVIAAAAFLVVLLAITAFEQLVGRSVSSYTGGSDDRRSTIFGGDESDEDQPDRRDRDRPSDESPTPTSEAPVESDDPSEDPEPSDEPTEEPSETEPTPTEPTPTEPPTTPPPTEPSG
jgi:hypothetical protein